MGTDMSVLNYITDIFKKKLKYKIIFELGTIIYLGSVPSFSRSRSFFPLLYEYCNSSPISISVIAKIPTLRILEISITFVVAFPSVESFSSRLRESSYDVI